MSTKKYAKFLAAALPILVAMVIAGALVRNRTGPEQIPAAETIRSVRMINVRPIEVVPRAVGYGYVRPARFWQAVAEVSGKIVFKSPLLERGEIVKQGAELIRIDPAPYELAAARIEAEMENIKAQIAELDVTEKNQTVLVEIEERNLTLSTKELERQRQLLQKKILSDSDYDHQQAAYHAQLAKVRNLKNSLNVIPAKRKALAASLSLNQARLQEARLDLDNTVLTAPFDCRIVDVHIERSQFVQRGQVLSAADGTGTAEIEAHLSIDKMLTLLRSVGRPVSIASLDFSALGDLFQLSAVVRLKIGDVSASWDARFVRAAASLDPKTGTVGVIVAVDRPYEKVRIGSHPPLVRNMYGEVELIGRPIPARLVIPRSALHDGYAYTLDPEDRLVRKKVAPDFTQADWVVLKDGLAPGDRLIVSDVIPAIDGMKMDPHEDTALAQRLYTDASGKTDGRSVPPEMR